MLINLVVFIKEFFKLNKGEPENSKVIKLNDPMASEILKKISASLNRYRKYFKIYRDSETCVSDHYMISAFLYSYTHLSNNITRRINNEYCDLEKLTSDYANLIFIEKRLEKVMRKNGLFE